MGFRSGMLAGQSSTVISWSANHLEVVLALWAGAKVLLEKDISISIRLISRWKHKVLQNLLVDGCIDCGLDKTQWTNISRRHCATNRLWLWKLHTDFKQLGFCPVFIQTLDLDFQMTCNIYFYPKRGLCLDHWARVQFFFSLVQVRCFWCCFCFRSGLVALFLKMSECGYSWCTSFNPLLVKLSQVFESASLNGIFKLAVIPVACAPLPTQFLPSSQLCI